MGAPRLLPGANPGLEIPTAACQHSSCGHAPWAQDCYISLHGSLPRPPAVSSTRVPPQMPGVDSNRRGLHPRT